MLELKLRKAYDKCEICLTEASWSRVEQNLYEELIIAPMHGLWQHQEYYIIIVNLRLYISAESLPHKNIRRKCVKIAYKNFICCVNWVLTTQR